KQDKHFSPEKFNKVLTKYNAAYRVINSIVQPISDENIIKNMEAAKNSSLSQEVREHLYKAQTLLSHKKYPDFNNSCLESIKAVEGTCRIIVGNEKILGDNIKEIKKLNYNQH